MTTSSFVFVEIKDPPAVSLLTDLRSALKGRASKSPIHITVRGPYKHAPQRAKLEDIWHLLEGEGLLLSGIGRFEFPERDVVYLRSHSRAIRRIWWKRDFPIIRYGFNPHITLYEGPARLARQVEAFLKKERLEFYCRRLALSLYETSVEPSLLPAVRTELFSYDRGSGNTLIEPYRWDDGVVERAQALVQRLESEISISAK